MWLRNAEVCTDPGALRIRHEATTGPECRLRSALLRWEPLGRRDQGGTGPSLAGLTWEGPGGIVLWGWPDDGGQIRLRPGPCGPEVCSVLPPALSLALLLRRSGVEPGIRTLIVGEGFPARVAQAVAAAVGCRITALAGRFEGAGGTEGRADLVIETTGDPRNLDWAVERCHDWGRVFSMGGALATAPLDYYSHVHLRALTITNVPERPLLSPDEEQVAERGTALLAEVLRGIAPAPDEVLDAHILPEDTLGRLARERSGWGLLLVDGRRA